MKLRLELADLHNYKYDRVTKTWTMFGRSFEHDEDVMTIEHVDGACTSAHWMRQPLSFKTAKITNDPQPPNLRKQVRFCSIVNSLLS